MALADPRECMASSFFPFKYKNHVTTLKAIIIKENSLVHVIVIQGSANWPVGQIQPTICFSMAQELIVVFTFLNG